MTDVMAHSEDRMRVEVVIPARPVDVECPLAEARVPYRGGVIDSPRRLYLVQRIGWTCRL